MVWYSGGLADPLISVQAYLCDKNNNKLIEQKYDKSDKKFSIYVDLENDTDDENYSIKGFKALTCKNKAETWVFLDNYSSDMLTSVDNTVDANGVWAVTTAYHQYRYFSVRWQDSKAWQYNKANNTKPTTTTTTTVEWSQLKLCTNKDTISATESNNNNNKTNDNHTKANDDKHIAEQARETKRLRK